MKRIVRAVLAGVAGIALMVVNDGPWWTNVFIGALTVAIGWAHLFWPEASEERLARLLAAIEWMKGRRRP